MARSAVDLELIVDEIRRESNILTDFENFPDGILYKWIHAAIMEAILKLDGIINNLYRAVSGNIAISGAKASFDATISHTASATTVTGFSGLDVNGWSGGSILAEDSDVLYAAQIASNTSTVVTITVGTDLPALSSVTVLLTANDSGNYIDLTSLSMIHFADPIWEVIDGSGNPIEKIKLENARRISSIPSYDSKVYWYQVGERIYFALGSGASISGNITVGYYVKPTEAAAAATDIDFPEEYQELIRMKVISRIFRRKGNSQEAALKESQLLAAWKDIIPTEMASSQVDRQYGERI